MEPSRLIRSAPGRCDEMPARRASSTCVSFRFLRHRWNVIPSRCGDMLVPKTNIFDTEPASRLQHQA